MVPLFSNGIEHARQFSYDEALEDFASANDHGALDEWVFERVTNFLLKEANASESKALEEDGNVFLLHLLGLDSSGHAHKPYSKEYYENVRIVDEGVRKVEAAFAEKFGNDEKTAFIFTADHGMSNKGAHGDGDPGCTETPLVVWGAGVAQGLWTIPGACRGTPKTPTEWGMNPETRCDVDQADVAPLGAALIGLPPPRHNSGLLPSTYLSEEPKSLRSSATIANAQQLLALHDLKAARTEKQALSAMYSSNFIQIWRVFRQRWMITSLILQTVGMKRRCTRRATSRALVFGDCITCTRTTRRFCKLPSWLVLRLG